MGEEIFMSMPTIPDINADINIKREDAANSSFDDIPRLYNKGNLFVYTVGENKAKCYSKSITGYHITNTLETL